MRHEVLAAFLGRTESVVSDVVAELLAVEEYARLEASAPDDLGQPVRWVVETFTDCLDQDRPLAPEEIRRFEDLGRQRKSQGIPLETVTSSFDAGLWYCWVKLVGLIWERTDPDTFKEVVADLLLGLRALRDAAKEAITRGYEGVDGTGRSDDERVIETPAVDGDVFELRLEAQARELGLNNGSPLGLIVAVPRTDSQAAGLREAGKNLAASLPGRAVAGPVLTTHSPHVVVLAASWSRSAAASEALLRTAAEKLDLVVIVQPVARLADLREAYTKVEAHVGVAPIVLDEPGLLSPGRLSSYGLLASGSPQHAERFIRDTIGLALAQRRSRCEEWVRTIELLDEAKGNVAEVAARLSLSEAGVKERLRVFASFLGMTQWEMKHSVDVFLAVRLLRVHRASLPPLGNPRWNPHD